MSILGVILVRIFPHSNWIRRDAEYHSVRMRENTDQKNSEYGNFSRSDILLQLVLSTSNTTLFCNKWDILCYWKSGIVSCLTTDTKICSFLEKCQQLLFYAPCLLTYFFKNKKYKSVSDKSYLAPFCGKLETYSYLREIQNSDLLWDNAILPLI